MESWTTVTNEERERVAATVGGRVFESTWFRRLGRISFLGPLDGHGRSRRASTRLEHSIGVAAWGVRVADVLELAPEVKRALVLACLLHDIGHFPFSHAAEAAFQRKLGASHHDVARYVILGEGPIGRARSLAPIIEAQDIDPRAVWALIEGGPGTRDRPAALLSAPINLDTLEGILRVARDFRLKKPNIHESVFTWVEGELSITAEGIAAVDAFWVLKDRVYERIINRPSNVLVEARLFEIVEAAIDESVFDRLESFDDDALRRMLATREREIEIREEDDEAYELRPAAAFGQVLARVRRHYEIDTSVETTAPGLPLREWGRRWRHRRETAFLISKRRQLDLPLRETTYETTEFE